MEVTHYELSGRKTAIHFIVKQTASICCGVLDVLISLPRHWRFLCDGSVLEFTGWVCYVGENTANNLIEVNLCYGADSLTWKEK